MTLCGFTVGYVNGYWRVFAYNGDGAELVYSVEFEKAERADRAADKFATEEWLVNFKDWRYTCES